MKRTDCEFRFLLSLSYADVRENIAYKVGFWFHFIWFSLNSIVASTPVGFADFSRAIILRKSFDRCFKKMIAGSGTGYGWIWI